MRLEAARDLIAEDPARRGGARRPARRAGPRRDREVRRLVDGLRPPALDQLGLVSALRQRAEEHNLAARSHADDADDLDVDADDDLEPLPAAVEVAAYRIVIEAVTNALRHSGADTCAVTLRRDAGALHIEVRDTASAWPPTRCWV